MINRSIVNEYPILSSASYETGNGFFSLKSIGRVAGIELHYKGVIEFDMNVPDGWLYTFRKNYLVIVADSETPLSEILFQYRGKLTIIKLLCMDFKGNKIVAKGRNKYNSYWGKIYSSWDKAGLWESYNIGKRIGGIVKKRAIKKITRKIKELPVKPSSTTVFVDSETTRQEGGQGTGYTGGGWGGT